MTQKSLSTLLKGLILAVGLFGAAFLAYASWGLFAYFNETAPYVVAFFVICIIPCYAVLVFSWGVASNIGKDKSFSYQNAKLLKYNAILAACDTMLFAVGIIVFLFTGMISGGFLGMASILLFFGVAASIIFASLSHLVYKAAVLQEQNDLTV